MGRSGAGQDSPTVQVVHAPSPSKEKEPTTHLVIKLSFLDTEQSYPAGQLRHYVKPYPEYVLTAHATAAV